jgi:hypothetical protein
MTRTTLAVNLIAYQCAWLACVWGVAAGRPELGVAVAAVAVLLHLRAAQEPRRELMLIGIAAFAGVAFESVLALSGWVRSSDGWLIGGRTPLMMVLLWGVFATTLNVALRSLRHRYVVCAVIAAVGAPLAYQAGERIGAMQWVSALPALLLVSAGWTVLLPVLMRAAQRFDGFART